MQLTRRQWLAATGGLLACTSGVAPMMTSVAQAGEIVVFGGPAFGTYWRIVLPTGADQRAIRQQVEAILVSVDRSMSPFRADTEISRFNNCHVDAVLPMSQDFATVVAESLRIADLTGGAFDPTVGPLVNQFGFGPIKGGTGASFADVKAGSALIGKARADVTLDLCGIAKGYALDKISQWLDAHGATDFIVEIGGEVFARGAHPQGRPWQVAIERPAPGARLVQKVVRLDGNAIATSSDAVNGYTFKGRRYSHIIDAHRAAPIDNGIASVSVIATTAMEADALATALMVLGPGKASAFAKHYNVPTLMLVRDGVAVRELALPGFGDYIVG